MTSSSPTKGEKLFAMYFWNSNHRKHLYYINDLFNVMFILKLLLLILGNMKERYQRYTPINIASKVPLSLSLT